MLAVALLVAVVIWFVLLRRYGGQGAQVQLDAIRTAGTLVVLTGGAMALLLTARRQRYTELTLVHLYEPINWHQLWSATTSEPDWLCPDILERGRLHAIYAPRKHKKSLFTLLLVAELITARSLLGRPNPHREPLRVLYIDIENAKDDIRQRLQDAGYGPDDLTNLTYLSFPSLPALDSPVGGQHLLALVEYHRPDLLVLDTTSRVVAGKENDADTFRALYRHALAPIKAIGTAVLRLDHAGKDLTLGQRGSSAKGDDLDTAWIITMPSSDRLTLRLDFQRTNHHPQEVELVQHQDPLRFVRIDSTTDRPELTTLLVELDRLAVPPDAGRPAARKALAEAEIKVGDPPPERSVEDQEELCPRSTHSAVWSGSARDQQRLCGRRFMASHSPQLRAVPHSPRTARTVTLGPALGELCAICLCHVVHRHRTAHPGLRNHHHPKIHTRRSAPDATNLPLALSEAGVNAAPTQPAVHRMMTTRRTPHDHKPKPRDTMTESLGAALLAATRWIRRNWPSQTSGGLKNAPRPQFSS